MFDHSIGELISLAAVLGWTISALVFESAGKRIGSVPVNIIRLMMAALIISLINILRGTTPWPQGIGMTDTLWLLASGFVGFFLGDLLLFRSYLIIGSRMAMLMMSLSPPISALLDRIVFGTRLAAGDGTGMALTMAGVALAVSGKGRIKSADKTAVSSRNARWIGLLLAFGGAAGQSGGMILGKLGMTGHDPLGSTFIRTFGGMAGFIPLILVTGALGRVIKGIEDKPAMLRLGIGAVAGPVLGVSAILLAMRYSPAGVVSAITAIVPITIIIPSIIFLKDKVTLREVLGAVVAVAGVVVLIVT